MSKHLVLLSAGGKPLFKNFGPVNILSKNSRKYEELSYSQWKTYLLSLSYLNGIMDLQNVLMHYPTLIPEKKILPSLCITDYLHL